MSVGDEIAMLGVSLLFGASGFLLISVDAPDLRQLSAGVFIGIASANLVRALLALLRGGE